jgi:hypothetical protein
MLSVATTTTAKDVACDLINQYCSWAAVEYESNGCTIRADAADSRVHATLKATYRIPGQRPHAHDTLRALAHTLDETTLKSLRRESGGDERIFFHSSSAMPQGAANTIVTHLNVALVVPEDKQAFCELEIGRRCGDKCSAYVGFLRAANEASWRVEMWFTPDPEDATDLDDLVTPWLRMLLEHVLSAK